MQKGIQENMASHKNETYQCKPIIEFGVSVCQKRRSNCTYQTDHVKHIQDYFLNHNINLLQLVKNGRNFPRYGYLTPSPHSQNGSKDTT